MKLIIVESFSETELLNDIILLEHSKNHPCHIIVIERERSLKDGKVSEMIIEELIKKDAHFEIPRLPLVLKTKERRLWPKDHIVTKRAGINSKGHTKGKRFRTGRK